MAPRPTEAEGKVHTEAGEAWIAWIEDIFRNEHTVAGESKIRHEILAFLNNGAEGSGMKLRGRRKFMRQRLPLMTWIGAGAMGPRVG